MTEPERRAGELRTLVARLRRDRQVITRIDARIDRAVERRESAARERESGAVEPEFAAAAALHLETLYTAIEASFGRIAAALEGTVPTGDDWHRLLLEQMSLDIHGVRPAVIDDDLARRLDLLRRFRHRIRHAYEEELEWQLMTDVLEARSAVVAALPAALDRIEGFLERAAAELGR